MKITFRAEPSNSEYGEYIRGHRKVEGGALSRVACHRHQLEHYVSERGEMQTRMGNGILM